MILFKTPKDEYEKYINDLLIITISEYNRKIKHPNKNYKTILKETERFRLIEFIDEKRKELLKNGCSIGYINQLNNYLIDNY